MEAVFNSMDDKEMYRLYALSLTDETIKIVSKERFHRMTAGYVLVFMKGKQPKLSIEITANEAEELTELDKEWLRSCIQQVMVELAMKDNNAETMLNKLEQVEKALQEEAKRYEEGKEQK